MGEGEKGNGKVSQPFSNGVLKIEKPSLIFISAQSAQ